VRERSLARTAWRRVPLTLAAVLLAGVIVAPFGEEILFRGFATTAWTKAFGPRRGLVQAALLFAREGAVVAARAGSSRARTPWGASARRTTFFRASSAPTQR